MGKKCKWRVSEILKDVSELHPDDVMYTRGILNFMRKVTKETIVDDLHVKGLLTKEIRKVIEQS